MHICIYKIKESQFNLNMSIINVKRERGKWNKKYEESKLKNTLLELCFLLPYLTTITISKFNFIISITTIENVVLTKISIGYFSWSSSWRSENVLPDKSIR